MENVSEAWILQSLVLPLTFLFPLLVCLFQPQNILLTSLSPLGDIKIVDFGLARRLGAGGELREIIGTPEYVGKMMFIPSIHLSLQP